MLAYENWESIVEEKKRELKGVIQESKKEDCNLEAASQKLERDVQSAIADGLPCTKIYQKTNFILASAKWFSSRAKNDLWDALSQLLDAHKKKGIFSSRRPIVVVLRFFPNFIDTDLKDVPRYLTHFIEDDNTSW